MPCLAAVFGPCLAGAKVLWHHLQIEGKTGLVLPFALANVCHACGSLCSLLD